MPCFNSRTPGGVRQIYGRGVGTQQGVSIHAPREGCDERIPRGKTPYRSVSIHAPREGCDSICLSQIFFNLCFNSRTPGGVRQVGGYEKEE